MNKTKNKRRNKTKNCKYFCEKIYLPERERLEIEYSKKSKNYDYRKVKPSTKKIIKEMFKKGCNDIYCQKSCKDNKSWLSSYTKERREKLMKQGATSGCRDLVKDFPKYYKTKIL